MNYSKFKPEARFRPGFIANTKRNEPSTNRLGGIAWSATGPRLDLGHPALLVTVDLATPLISQSVGFGCNFEIPLFSYINIDGIIPIQEYQFDQRTKTAIFKPLVANVKLLPVENRLAIPLPDFALGLREMRENEIPKDETSYWRAIDTFLGGESVIRLCGDPIYIDYVAPKNDGFDYFASIGYESQSQSNRLLKNEAFFLGEMAHYFFISNDWKTVRVVCQAS